MDYLYDGTFEGLLTCIYLHYKTEKASGIYEARSYQYSVMNNFLLVETDIEKAAVVSDAINSKVSAEAYIHVFYCFLSNVENKENIILDFLIFAFKYGKNTMNFYSHEKILKIKEAYTKVARELQGFLGILRFSDIDGILYSKFSPDNDLLILLIDHFADRYRYEKFIIHDERRRKAAVYGNDRWEIKEDIRIENMEYSSGEETVHSLWRQYFNDLAIKERKNIKLQFQFVPARYRKNMTEFTSK